MFHLNVLHFSIYRQDRPYRPIRHFRRESGNANSSNSHPIRTDPNTGYFAICTSVSIFSFPAGRLEHIPHSFRVLEFYVHVTFGFIDLHHKYLLIFKTHLGIYHFMNLISRNSWAAVFESTDDRVLQFTYVEKCLPPSRKEKQTRRERQLTSTTTNTIPFTNHDHHYSARTQPSRCTSRTGLWTEQPQWQQWLEVWSCSMYCWCFILFIKYFGKISFTRIKRC
jgi:hypothetical protein